MLQPLFAVMALGYSEIWHTKENITLVVDLDPVTLIALVWPNEEVKWSHLKNEFKTTGCCRVTGTMAWLDTLGQLHSLSELPASVHMTFWKCSTKRENYQQRRPHHDLIWVSSCAKTINSLRSAPLMYKVGALIHTSPMRNGSRQKKGRLSKALALTAGELKVKCM